MLNARAYRKRACIAAAVLAAVVCSPVADAQLLRNAQALPSVSTLSSSASADLQPGYTRDLISGNGSRGPYTLSWSGIPTGRESVVVDGRIALRAVDYSLDAGKGTITFTAPLGAASLARVEYPLNPRSSRRNAVLSSIPVALDLYASDRSSLQFTALYKPQGAPDAAGVGVLGLQGKTRVSAQTELTTALFVSPGSSGAPGAGSAARIGATSKLGDFGLTGSYVHAGKSFVGSGDYGFASGQDVQNLGLTYAPKASRLSFASGYQRVTLDDPLGRVTTTLDHSLTYKLAPGADLLFSRKAVGTDVHGVVGSLVTDVFQVGGTVGKKSRVVLTWTDQATANGGDRDRASTRVLKVTSGLVNNVAFNASYRLAQTSADGPSSALDVGITAKPLKSVEVHAGFAGKGNAVTGPDNSGSIRVAAVPGPRIKLSAGVTDRQTASRGMRTQDLRFDSRPLDFLTLSGGYAFTDGGDSAVIARDIAATIAPWSFISVDGSYRTRDLPGESLDSALLNLTVNPLKSIGIVAALANNPEDSKGNIGRYDTRSLGVRASVGALSLTGAYAFKDEYLVDRRWFQTQLGVGLALARATQLTSDYEYSETAGFGSSSRRITVGLRRDLGQDFNIWLSGSRTDTEDSAAYEQRVYEAEMKLGVRF